MREMGGLPSWGDDEDGLEEDAPNEYRQIELEMRYL